MTHGRNVKEFNYSIDDYCSDISISEDTKAKIDEIDILVLPHKYAEKEYYFAQESIRFIKYCRSIDSQHSIDILADGDNIETRALHSFDLFMPIIFVASSVLFPITINLISSYIYDRIKGREKEDVSVKVSFVVRNGKSTKELHYDGDAKTFKETFEKIDINKL